MELKRLAPWNWFKDEENATPSQVEVSRNREFNKPSEFLDPVDPFRRDINDLFNRYLHGYGLAFPGAGSFFKGYPGKELLKPMLDINANDTEYTISVEVPGIKQEDIKLEINNNILTIRGEKRQEKEDKGKNYYTMERSYGSFQRILSLPDDVEQDTVEASFNNGILNITMSRTALPATNSKQIQIK